MKKKVLSLLLALLILVCSLPWTAISVAAETLNSGESGAPIVSIEPEESYDLSSSSIALAKPDASGYARFIIKATGEITEDITVYYATEDQSAIAVAGDYEAKIGSVVLTKEKPQVDIAIKTVRADYSINVNVHNGSENYNYLSRSFLVKLTGVSGSGAKADKNKSQVECALLAEHSLEAYSFSGTTVLTPYTSYGRYNLLNVLKTDACSGGKAVYNTLNVSFPSNWLPDYVNSGLNAKLYMALQNAHIDESSWNSSSGVSVTIGDNAMVYLTGEFHDNEVFGWGPAFLNAVYGADGENDKLADYFDENYVYTRWQNFDGTVTYVYAKKGDMESALAKKYVIVRKSQYYGAPNSVPNDAGMFYIGIDDGILNKSALDISLFSEGGFSRKLSGGDVSFMIEDVTAPQIKTNSDGSYAIYHNFNTATAQDKLRLAIRFDEPVQVDGNNPYITGKINGIGTGVEPHPYAITFKYVGGSGTDTLYFESEYSGNHQITSITDLKFIYSNSIKDFAGEANAFSQSSSIVIDGFNLDRRTPVIKVSAADAKMSDWGKTKSVAVTVSNISEGATLYYSWCTPGATPTLENKIALNNVTVNGTKTATIISEGDGVKNLYLKAVSKYGQEQTAVTIVNNASTTTQEYLGPYNFDNSAPTVDTSKLVPQNGSSTFEKSYVIPPPSDAGAGFYEIKMYYVGTDKESHLIENKTFNASSFKDSSGNPHDLQFTLSAEEVGVYEGVRREVTVFFTLTDAIGNTSGEVARHKVIFDTNTYMELESAVPVSDFYDNTEVIDEGYTFIYNGNAQETYTGAYYSFLMTVLESNVGDTVIISVSKNGVVLEGGYTPTVTKARVDDKSVYLARVDFTSPMSEGYYDLQLLSYESGTNVNDGADLISRVYRIYIGSGSGGLDEQISAGTVLVNKVYQLPQLSYFYYMNNNGTIGSIVKETYNGTNLAPSFSTEDKAYEYVLFNEYRDVYAVTLTAELAEALNAGNSNAQKALGEETVAREGQVWIRYKSASWDGLKTPNSNDWVFYYYGTTEVLDVTHFSPLLTGALDSVAKRITARGQTVALTDFSLYTGGTGSLVDGLGAPYLSPLQIHAQDKRLNNENRNSSFATEITYTADTAIYSSDVVINGLEYILIGNVTIPSESRLQYKRIDENGLEDELWTDLVFDDGQRFGDVLIGGRYKIRELSEGGVTQANVYIDKDAPMVLVTWKDKDGASQSQILNQSSEKEFRARSFKIVGIDAREYDKYSYVALYNTSNSKLYGVYMLNDLQRASVDVPDGNYYMVIADRSGNSYTMTVHINSTELKPEVVISKNVKIKFTCDRKESQIQEFYVKRNGVLVSGKYASELEFTESGAYEFYVKDIYGNVFGPEIYEFDRVYPEVTWKYRDETGHFVNYDSENKTKYFTVDSVFDGVYTISTSVNMKFQIPSNYAFTFLGTAPEHEVSLDGTVTIKTAQSFQLKVYYQKHPDVYTVYNCSADTSAPVIDASIEVVNPIPDELEELRLAIGAGAINSGAVLIPSKISYSPKSIQTKHLVNNEVVMSDLIKVSVHDESGLAYVYVYLDGKLIKELSAAEYASSGIALSKAGEYKIVAEDTLGNKSEFIFKNGTHDSLRYTVDGIPMALELSAFEKFDENGNYKDSCFGNEAVSFVIAESMKAFFMVTDSCGQKYFVAFDVSGGTIREICYCVDEDGDLVLKTLETVLLDGTNPQTAKNKEYAIYEIAETGVKIYASVNSYGSVTLTLYASDESELTVEARFNTEDNEFYYTKTELSSFSADLTIQTTEGIMQAGESKDLIKLNRPFKISTNGFEQDKISGVQIYYSKINDFSETGFFERDDIYEEGLFYEGEGFYFIRLVNKYGNESSFIVRISYKFDVTPYSQLSDGEKLYYSGDYAETIYSNDKVIFEVYSSGVTVNVEKDGEAFAPVINVENGITYIILSEEGNYAVTLTDAYRNEIKKSVQIDKSELTFNEDLLTGYNENALKKDEGYTNQKLSVSKDVLDKEMIYYLAVQYGDTTEVLYDSISAEKISLDEGKLSKLIGSLGDGEYTVVVRNRYGAAATKVIHYRETPTLILEREIRSSTEAEAYDIDKAVSIGFWSNGELIFKTDAEYYVFTVNGDKTECPKTLSFASATQQARTEYVITYVDEYGFSYSFKAYLVRQTLEIKPDLSKDGLDINGVLTTTENIAVLFSENASCTYTWNNSAEKTYTPGEKLTRDGVYRFVVTDYAGNMSALTIKKDTTVEFAFVKANSNAEIQNGGVVNGSKVNFQILNNDSAYIEKVFKDGVEQKDFTGSKFGDDGKWELIISDKLGNKSYFSFYIITKEKNGFAYTTPYEYFVTELWYDSGDGVKISYLKFVNHTDSSSSFELSENGKYTVTMTSSVTGDVSQFEFTVNTTAPAVSLVGCGVGETTINDVTVTGCKTGDTIRVYRATGTGEELVQEITVTSTSTKMPTVNEGGEYRIVVESEAGVETELNFIRKHVMNTEGSVFVIILISIAVVGLFIGLIYRNKSKTDE